MSKRLLDGIFVENERVFRRGGGKSKDPALATRKMTAKKSLPAVIVSGLPRSGTSMLMQMLDAAGFPLLHDAQRRPDPSNPLGYYEFAPIKGIQNRLPDLDPAAGRAVKIVAPLLPMLPDRFDCRVVFIEREMNEVLASQHAMLGTSDSDRREADERSLARAFEASLRAARAWLANNDRADVCFVSHAQTVQNPADTAERVLEFLESHSLIPVALRAESGRDRDPIVRRMASVFDPDLYRQRSARS